MRLSFSGIEKNRRICSTLAHNTPEREKIELKTDKCVYAFYASHSWVGVNFLSRKLFHKMTQMHAAWSDNASVIMQENHFPVSFLSARFVTQFLLLLAVVVVVVANHTGKQYFCSAECCESQTSFFCFRIQQNRRE